MCIRDRQGTGRRRQGPKPQFLPFLFRQAAELLPVEGALQHPVPQIERPVDQICKEIQPMLRNHHRAALMFQTGDLVVEPSDGVLVQIGRGLVQHKNLRAHGDVYKRQPRDRIAIVIKSGAVRLPFR